MEKINSVQWYVNKGYKQARTIESSRIRSDKAAIGCGRLY